jgi:hypothetical protein
MKDEILEKELARVPEDGAEGRGRKEQQLVADRREKIVEQKEHPEGKDHVEGREGIDKRRFHYEGGQRFNDLRLDHHDKDEAEKKYRLDYCKNGGEKKLLAFSFNEALWIFAEDNVKRGPQNGEQPRSKKEEEQYPQRAGQLLRYGDDVQLLDEFLDHNGIVRIRYDILHEFHQVRRRVAKVYYIAKDKDGEEGEGYKGQEHIITDGRDDDVPVVLLVFFKKLLDDVPGIISCLLDLFFVNAPFHNPLVIVAHRNPKYQFPSTKS